MRIHCSKEELAVRPKAFFVDLDHTLYDYDGPHRFAQSEVEKRISSALSLSPADTTAACKAARDTVKAQLGSVAASHSRLLYFQSALERLGAKSMPLLALDLERIYWRSFLSRAVLFENVVETLMAMRAIGSPIVMVSDLTTGIQLRKVLHFRLQNLLDFIVTSEEAGREKPDAAIFDLARRKAGVGAGDRVWMIGDNPLCDLDGPRAHLNALVFLRRPSKDSAHGHTPDAVFDHFSDLMALVNGLPR